MINKHGNLYKVDLQNEDVQELLIRENTTKGIKNYKLQPSESPIKNYCEIYSFINDDFFFLRNEHVIDLYDFNLQHKANFLINSSDFKGIKVFSDKINIYLVIFNQSTI